LLLVISALAREALPTHTGFLEKNLVRPLFLFVDTGVNLYIVITCTAVGGPFGFILGSLCLTILIVIFPVGPGLAGTRMCPFWISLELRMMEVVSGDKWSYKMHNASYSSNEFGAIRVWSSHHL